MNRKLGGGRQPTGTPSLAWSCLVVVCSLLGGASIVHNIYKPNLVSFILHFNNLCMFSFVNASSLS
ncbi:hypothetical protein AHAS_Ahas16G0232900 [Arachis hypogaea]